MMRQKAVLRSPFLQKHPSRCYQIFQTSLQGHIDSDLALWH